MLRGMHGWKATHALFALLWTTLQCQHHMHRCERNAPSGVQFEISTFSIYSSQSGGGTYNPVTDVYTVDPLIVYDTLEGAEVNNVARSCYAWGNIRWTFEQCYNTLSGVVELGAGSNNSRGGSKTWFMQETAGAGTEGMDGSRNVDEMSPLLELLLSF